jgi:hypothetical protein
MTITRLKQAGGEFDAANGANLLAGYEWDSQSANFHVSSNNPKSGTYSYNPAGSTDYAQWNVNTSQLRTAGHWMATAAAGPASIMYNIRLLDAQNNVLVGVGFLNNDLKLYIGGSVQATATSLWVQNQYRHIGLDVKIDASAGWANVYIDGVLVASFSGATGSNPVTQVRWGGAANSAYGNYLDDLYLDDSTGESAPAALADRRFVPLYPNANGTYSEGTGSDGNKVDNYLLVDDHSAANGDTDYVEATALDQRETYNLTTTTIPNGWAVAAVIPIITVEKTDAVVDTKAALMLRYNGTDWQGADQSLPSAYGNRWEQRTTQPDGSAWTQAAIDGLEAGFRGRGTF